MGETSFGALAAWAAPRGYQPEHVAGVLVDLGCAGVVDASYRGALADRITKVYRRTQIGLDALDELAGLEQAERRYLRRRGWQSSTRKIRPTKRFAPLPIHEEVWAHPRIVGRRPTEEALALQRLLDRKARARS